jgi:hypothetical protein
MRGARRAAACAAVLMAGFLSAGPAGQGATAAPSHGEALARMADEVAKEVEQLRGWTFKRPVKKERINVQQARADVRRMLLANDTSDRRARVQAFLRIVGLIPADCDLIDTSLALLDQQVAGYYEPATRTLRLVDRATPTPPFVERMILAHELTHALDDQYIDLADLIKPAGGNQDTDFVATALEEGSATALMLHQMSAAQRSGRFGFAELAQYMTEELARAKTLEQLPRYFSAMFASYIVGAGFLAKGELDTLLTQPDNRAVGDALLQARRQLPRSSEQMLHSEKYWDPARRDEPVIFDDRAIDRWLSKSGRHVLHRDTVGELLTSLLTAPRDASRDLASLQAVSAWTNAGAAGWGGDRFYLLADQNSPAVLQMTKALQGVWVSAWDTPKDRDEFLGFLEKGSPAPNSVAVPVGHQLAVVFVSISQAEREALLRRIGLLPIPMTRGGRPWVQQ